MRQSKITFLTSVGAGLEYYDFVIYSLLASFISQQFFPEKNRVAALFATFVIFAVSNIVRPIGGTILGVLGDLFGRKNIFTHTLLWMAGISFLMGIVPSFAVWGLAGTIAFGILRVFQGMVFGAEFPGALTLLSEHIDTKRQGLHFGFVVSAVGLGVSFGSIVIWSITKLLSETQMVAWGFRIPFLLGGFLALIGFYIRKYVPETPKFLALKKSKEKISFKIVRSHLWSIINIIGILLFPSCLITFKIIFPVYLRDFYHFSWSNIYLAMTLSYVLAAVILPVFGWISDYVGKKILIITGSLVMVVFVFPMFRLLNTGATWAPFAFILFLQTVTGIMAASYFTLLPRAFKTVMRYTGTAVSHNTTHMLASLTPLAVTYIYGVLKEPTYLIWMFISLATLTILSTLVFKIRTDEESAQQEVLAEKDI